MTQNRGTAQLAPARADLPIPAPAARTPAARRPRLTGRPALYLLASLVVSLLAASAAPTPLYAIYQRMWGFTPITITIVFGVYAVAVLAALLTLGRLSDSIGGGRCCWPPSPSRSCRWWCTPPRAGSAS